MPGLTDHEKAATLELLWKGLREAEIAVRLSLPCGPVAKFIQNTERAGGWSSPVHFFECHGYTDEESSHDCGKLVTSRTEKRVRCAPCSKAWTKVQNKKRSRAWYQSHVEEQRPKMRAYYQNHTVGQGHCQEPDCEALINAGSRYCRQHAPQHKRSWTVSCDHCGEEFETRSPLARFCPDCRPLAVQLMQDRYAERRHEETMRDLAKRFGRECALGRDAAWWEQRLLSTGRGELDEIGHWNWMANLWVARQSPNRFIRSLACRLVKLQLPKRNVAQIAGVMPDTVYSWLRLDSAKVKRPDLVPLARLARLWPGTEDSSRHEDVIARLFLRAYGKSPSETGLLVLRKLVYLDMSFRDLIQRAGIPPQAAHRLLWDGRSWPRTLARVADALQLSDQDREELEMRGASARSDAVYRFRTEPHFTQEDRRMRAARLGLVGLGPAVLGLTVREVAQRYHVRTRAAGRLLRQAKLRWAKDENQGPSDKQLAALEAGRHVGPMSRQQAAWSRIARIKAEHPSASRREVARLARATQRTVRQYEAADKRT
jgi:hypothetical protein